MKSKTILLIILLIPISFGFNQKQLRFSADIAESYRENNVKVKVFKDNVKIIDEDKILYTDLANYYQDTNKVVLYGSVIMHDKSDSLICNKLILIKGSDERYEASGDVIGSNLINSLPKPKEKIFFNLLALTIAGYPDPSLKEYEKLFLRCDNVILSA